jgi:triacylglycerol esterase/lipase EstA (alpha/beta hydrolase family)
LRSRLRRPATLLCVSLVAGGAPGPATAARTGPRDTDGCRGSTPAAHLQETSIPVLLVPGWYATGRVMAPLLIRLVAAGWAEDHVMALTFSDPTGSNRDHAGEIAVAVDSLMARTGAGRVDIVAHSMGGLAVRLYLDQGGAVHVRRVVFLATPQRGTYTAYLAFGRGRDEMIPGSDFLKALNEGPSVPPGVEALTIRTVVDAHIVPEESATLPGVPDVQLCCPTHQGLLANMDVFRAVWRFLAEGTSGGEDCR